MRPATRILESGSSIVDKAVVLLSGGLNGAVAAATMREQYELYPLFIAYHQRAMRREAEAFEAQCTHLGVKHHWRAELSHFKQVGGSAIVDTKRDVEDATALDTGVPATFVPMLLPTLLNTAAAFAQRIGARVLVTGISEAIDQPPPGRAVMYPDQRREFIYSYQYMLDAALPDRQRIRVETPVIDFQRREIVRLGARFKVPFDSTWSCYLGDSQPCCACYGCASRAVGFAEAREPDPLLLTMQEN